MGYSNLPASKLSIWGSREKSLENPSRAGAVAARFACHNWRACSPGSWKTEYFSFENSFNAHCALSVTRISFTCETHLTSFKSSKVSSFKGQLFFSAAWTAAPERLWASRKGTWKNTANVLKGCTTLQLTELWEEHYSNWVFNFLRYFFGIFTTNPTWNQQK